MLSYMADLFKQIKSYLKFSTALTQPNFLDNVDMKPTSFTYLTES